MNSGHVARLLAIRQELSPDQETRVERHLQACPSCLHLDAVYRRQDDLIRRAAWVDAPIGLEAMVLDRAHRQRPKSNWVSRLRRSLEGVRVTGTEQLAWVLAIVLVVGGLITAHDRFAFSGGQGISDLGPPTGGVVPHTPLGSFRHTGPYLRSSGKPELLFIGTYADFTSAAERWPIVKALDQFGSFSKLSATTTRDCGMLASRQPSCFGPTRQPEDTYNWIDAGYQSRYLTFVHKDLIEPDLGMRQKLSPPELSLFNRYVRLAPYRVHLTRYNSFQEAVWYTATRQIDPYGFPLVSVGGYLAAHGQVAIDGDLGGKMGGPVPFDAIQRSLQQGRAVGDASPSMVTDFNAEANIITALICHADGKKPGSVCNRPVIKAILKHISAPKKHPSRDKSVVPSRLAATSITNLGRATNDVPPHNPLGAFRHTGPNLRSGGKPAIFFIGTQADAASAAERWPVVKALGQFGRWSGLAAVVSRSCVDVQGQGVRCLQAGSRQGNGNDPVLPTFDWDGAHYYSRYLTFEQRDLLDQNLRVHQLHSPTELRLFQRYASGYGGQGWNGLIWDTVLHTPQGRGFPLLLVDGYLEVGANTAIPGDLTPSTSTDGLPFSVVKQSLQHGRPVDQAPVSLVPDFSAETNVITALICHADGKKPRSVCSRPAIRTILKHVR